MAEAAWLTTDKNTVQVSPTLCRFPTTSLTPSFVHPSIYWVVTEYLLWAQGET